jgi:hydroxymethylbilane synthase
MPTRFQKLRLGSRASLLALAQSNLIAAELMHLHPNLQIDLIPINTTGDRITDRPLHEAGGKGLFTKELEQALLKNEIDFAVHSFKDVPITMPLVDQADLITAAVPEREDPRDVLISLSARSIHDLSPSARVGTGSLRRRCQLLDARPDLTIQPIRGNIDTRLQKLLRGEFDAILLALAGLRRSGLFDPSIMFPIHPDDLPPGPGQGALSLQCRRNDDQTRDLLHAINHPLSADCVALERKVVEILNGDCHSPIAAFAEPTDHGVRLRVAVGEPDGHPPVRWADLNSPELKDLTVAHNACNTLVLRQ